MGSDERPLLPILYGVVASCIVYDGSCHKSYALSARTLYYKTSRGYTPTSPLFFFDSGMKIVYNFPNIVVTIEEEGLGKET